MPYLYIVAGCNGAGKTTASYSLLPGILNCREFVNADEIARGLSPFQPETAALAAGRLMLNRIRYLMGTGVDFAFETTLATRSYKGLISEAKMKGYHVSLVFFWLNSPELAVNRVENRVRAGGHNIPEEVIRRRYWRGIENLFQIYMPLCDAWAIFENSWKSPMLIAKSGEGNSPVIKNQAIWEKLMNYGKEN
ncbi:MAG: zeta toxin [Saprospiraceae bacterium]|nr:MAG: zeta toxin [Saprospiraceae bacterium]